MSVTVTQQQPGDAPAAAPALGSDQHLMTNLLALLEGVPMNRGIELLIGSIVTAIAMHTNTSQNAASNVVQASSALLKMVPQVVLMHQKLHGE